MRQSYKFGAVPPHIHDAVRLSNESFPPRHEGTCRARLSATPHSVVDCDARKMWLRLSEFLMVFIDLGEYLI
jgi:hypothetical protein